MSHEDQHFYKRAVGASIVGLVLQALLAVVMLIVGLYAQSPALHAATWHMFGGLAIWLVLIVLYNQHRLERIETLEAEQLARSDARAAALFDEHGDQLAIARRRLANLYKYGLNVVSLLTAVYLITVGTVLVLINLKAFETGDLPALAMGGQASALALIFLTAGITFVAFIAGRYEAGMTQIEQWKQIRGGAGYLMGSALVSGLGFIGALFASFAGLNVLAALAVVIPAVSILLGLEMVLNFVLAVYRPRRAGETPRPAFDSRLLAMLTSPESIAHALGEAINYQFGFEVSKSWFYQLLARAITPLILFGIAVLWLISSVVIVGPSQQAIVTHFGAMKANPILEPGLHVKWPWPIDLATKYEVGRVHTIEVGSAPQGLKEDTALLWTNPHVEGEREDYLVVAPTPGRDAALRRAAGEIDVTVPGMSLIGVQIMVQYRIDDLVAYASHTAKPQEQLRSLIERQVNAYFVTRDIDDLIGPGRLEAGHTLRQRIQETADRHRLGVKILFVGLAGLHPPQQGGVAESFHAQVGALQEQQSEIQKAEREAIEMLAEVAGSLAEARQLVAAIDELLALDERLLQMAEDARRNGVEPPAPLEDMQAQADRLRAQVDALLASAQGETARRINEALAFRWSYSLGQRAKAERFTAELEAFHQAPRLYMVREAYRVVGESMQDARKIVVTTDNGPQMDRVFRLNLQDQAAGIESILRNE